jgi:threonyl-tRNA synthetase
MALPGGEAVAATDVEPLERVAGKIIQEKQPFVRLTLTKENLLEMFKSNKYKQHIIRDKIPDGTSTTVYRCGPLIDLCRSVSYQVQLFSLTMSRGPHVPHTGYLYFFTVSCLY